MMKHYSVRFTIIHNAGVTAATGMSRSVRKAFAKAAEKAWTNYETSGATNWADEWVTIYRPNGTVAAGGWSTDFANR
jgi:hypothetical protein